ncbi:TonB-dependent receptor [Gilvimarinus algae]|uniref:TonB-dependent receptor n=1 Tax=Gilvimarinus algae TaxID=3058037 RepID=A0ABT8TJG4_9GAMM|nr:TonB-dependent receptor [Gilvimarinus sp. SDUM040014]MDO3383725.1 TonB-dependent receptor [Gilvimarinus sp. SDUM040014]
MNKLLRSPLALAIALANTSLATQAWAQSEQPQTEKPKAVLEEIVVTATKRETNLMDTPIAITVMTEEVLTRQGLSNVKDIDKLVPNMDITIDSSQSAPVISMRGVRSTNITELGDPAVGLHLDGIYSPRPQGAMALMFDVSRVEAQRGPQGTLFGRNSTVGNVNIITQRPQVDEFEASLGIELGNFNHRQMRGMVNIPVSDTFALRGSFMVEERDSYLNGYYDPNQWDIRYLPEDVQNAPLYTGSEEDKNLVQRARWWEGGADGVQEVVKADESDFYNNSDQYAFRLAAQWEPTADFSWHLAYEHFQDDSAGSTDTIDCDKAALRVRTDDEGNYLDAQGNPSATPVPGSNGCSRIYGPGADSYTVNVSVPGMQDLTIQNVRSNLQWDFTDSMAFVYNAGWAKQTRTQMSDQDRGITDWDMSIFFRDATFVSHSHELQLQSTDNGPLQWVTGLFFFEENNDMQGGWMNSMASADYWNQSDRTLASKAAFAQGTYSITDKLHLTLGYRYTEDTKEDIGGHNMACNDSNPNLLEPELNDGRCFPSWDRTAYNNLPTDYFWNKDIYTVSTDNDIKGEWDYNNYRLGLDYDLSDNTMIFAYVANGTKSGGIGDVVVQYEQDPQTTEYPLDENGDRIVKQRHENTYDPEEVITYEAGIKSDLFDNSLRLSVSAFFSDYKDMQVATAKPLFVTYSWERDPETGEQTDEISADPFTVFQTDNIGKAEIKGLEIEFDWAITNNDRLNGYVSYLDTEIVSDFVQQWTYATVDLFEISYDESVNPENTQLTTNLKGNELPSSPRYSLNLNYSHTFDFDSGATLLPWVNVSWKDKAYFSIFNTDKHEDLYATDTPDAFSDTREAVTNVNLGIKYTAPGDNWSLEAFCNNATDETEFYWGGSGDGVIKGPVSMPRFYGVRANYHF